MVVALGGAILKFDSVDAEFCSSPLDPAADQRKTNRFFTLAQVSLGAANVGIIDDKYLNFVENAFTKLDGHNLMYCQFLNLRGSLFKEL